MSWDGHMRATSAGAAVAGVLRHVLVHDLLECGLAACGLAGLPKAEKKCLEGFGFMKQLRAYSYLKGAAGGGLNALRMLRRGNASWWVRACGGRDALLARALDRTALVLVCVLVCVCVCVCVKGCISSHICVHVCVFYWAPECT